MIESHAKNKKVIVIRQKKKEPRNGNQLRGLVHLNLPCERDTADAPLYSDESDERIYSDSADHTIDAYKTGIMCTSLTENQAVASIVTEDDANPLSENGDSERFQQSMHHQSQRTLTNHRQSSQNSSS